MRPPSGSAHLSDSEVGVGLFDGGPASKPGSREKQSAAFYIANI